jgi:hypothetical protein
MRSNWNPMVVVVVLAAAFTPIVYDLVQPIDFHRGTESRIPIALFLGSISVFFVCVIVSRRFARVCARTPEHLPKTIRDAQISLVPLAVCWLLFLLVVLFER